MKGIPYNGNLPPGCSEREISESAEPPKLCEGCGKPEHKCRCDYEDERAERQLETLREIRAETDATWKFPE